MLQIYLKKIDEWELPVIWKIISETCSEWQQMNDPLNEQPIPSKELFFSEVAHDWVEEGNPLLVMQENEIIGVTSWSHISYDYPNNENELVFDIGLILFDKEIRGKGYGAEALSLIVDYLFLMTPYLDGITITTWTGNYPMIALIKKFNLPLSLVKREAFELQDNTYERVVYRLNREIWEGNVNEY